MSGHPGLYEWRRLAPLHWQSRAENAWFSCYTLEHCDENNAGESAKTLGYKGTPSVALAETFQREAALAIELLCKGIIAQDIEYNSDDDGPSPPGIPKTHDIPWLWQQAGLPKLAAVDTYRLALMKSTLYWSGRYPVPTSAAEWARESKELDALFPTEERVVDVRFKAVTPIGISWSDFNRIYKVAAERFAELYDRSHPLSTAT